MAGVHLRGGARRIGYVLCVSGVSVLAWGALGGPTQLATFRVATSDPGCAASSAAPGVVVVCLHEAHEGITAESFATKSCDNIGNRDTSLDYFVFVLPAAGDAGRVFTTPAPTVYLGHGTVTGVIGTNAKFFYAAASHGETLLEAVAHADNGAGTPTGGDAEIFNLTHTCPATSTSTTSTSSGTSTVTSTVTVTTTDTVHDTVTVTTTVTDAQTTTVTVTDPVTTTVTSTVKDPVTTTVTDTVNATTTKTVTNDPGTTSTSPSSTSSRVTGGVAAVVGIPNTGGGDRGQIVLLGTGLALAGAALVGVAPRRPRQRVAVSTTSAAATAQVTAATSSRTSRVAGRRASQAWHLPRRKR